MRSFLLACLTWLSAALLSAFALVVDGKPAAAIVIPPHCSAARRLSAELLQEYVRRSTGALLPIRDRRGSGAALLLGRSPQVDALALHLDALDEDGFVLREIDARTYVIAGPTEWGTEYGVDEVLERFAGVRWLMPGEHGTDVPRRSSLVLPRAEVRQQPAFFCRGVSGFPNDVQRTWARRNRMRGRLAFHENLFRLFPPSRYAVSHPEFYPILSGRRYIPQSDADYNWEPDLAAPGIAEEAARTIIEYFRSHPEAASYSLAVNDSPRWDESSGSLARENRRNFLGFRDMSETYYRWCNQVVAIVTKQYPDKWFGVLAYQNVAEPPHFRLDPHIVPFLTYDRMKWARPALRSEGEGVTQRWCEASPVVGWYDYVYGAPYAVPRVYPHLMAANLRFARAAGVRAQYAELAPNWGEGPKPYVLMKLLWDPNADVEALLDDWYVRCAGRAAAPALRKYYDLWEDFWTRRAPQSKWWIDQGIFLDFDRPGYLAEVTRNDIRRSRELLDEVVAKASTTEQRARAVTLRSAFAYYEATAIAYGFEEPARSALPFQRAIDDVQSLMERLVMAWRRVVLVQSFEHDPVLVQPSGIRPFPHLRGVAILFERAWK